jgi:hypothetical protein
VSKGTITITLENEEGEEISHTLPAVNEVCDRCEGFGTHLNPNIGQHAYSPEEFNEAFDDEESREAYFTRGGMYDVQCEECHGNKVILIVDESNLSPAQKEIYQQHSSRMDRRAEEEAADRRTRWMEDGCPRD